MNLPTVTRVGPSPSPGLPRQPILGQRRRDFGGVCWSAFSECVGIRIPVCCRALIPPFAWRRAWRSISGVSSWLPPGFRSSDERPQADSCVSTNSGLVGASGVLSLFIVAHDLADWARGLDTVRCSVPRCFLRGCLCGEWDQSFCVSECFASCGILQV